MTGPRFERWRVDLPPRSERTTDAMEWTDALVTVEQGVVEVVCAGGGRRTFREGALLALCWLPVAFLRNPTAEITRLVAVRRRPRCDREQPDRGRVPVDPEWT